MFFSSRFRNRLWSFSILILIILYSKSTLIANTSETDSLEQLLEFIEDDNERGDLLLTLFKSYINSDLEKSEMYANKALELAQNLGDKDLEGIALKSLGIVSLLDWELDEAAERMRSAQKILLEANNMNEVQKCYNNLGNIYYRKGDYDLALENYNNALQVFDKNEESILISGILSNIGNIHSANKNVDKSIQYYNEALKIIRKKGNPKDNISALVNLGSQYSKKNEYEKAIEIYQEALALSKEIDNKRIQVTILMNLGNRYSNKNEAQKAMRYYKEALTLAEETGNSSAKARIYYNMATYYKAREDYDNTIDYAEKALALSTKVGDKNWTLNIYKVLIESNVAKNNMTKAFQYKTLFHETQDSLFNIEKSEKIVEISTKYETEKKEIENQLLKEDQAKKEAVISQQRKVNTLTGLILALLILLLGILYRNFQNKKKYSTELEKEVKNRTMDLEKSNNQLKTSNMELERFAYIASHDLKEPAKNIINFTSILEEQIPNEIKENQLIDTSIQYIKKNSKQMDHLIEDILEFSMVDTRLTENIEININELVDAVIDTFKSNLNDNQVIFKVDRLPDIKVNKSAIFQVLKNLIGNGIKFNDKEKPVISIFGELKNGNFEISVKDNGIGIEEKYFDQIFVMFKRLNNRSDYLGSGLGLSICKKILTDLGGDISVKSKEGEGSIFTFWIPEKGE